MHSSLIGKVEKANRYARELDRIRRFRRIAAWLVSRAVRPKTALWLVITFALVHGCSGHGS